MAYGITPDFGDDQLPPESTANSGTYLDIDPNQALYDPAFLTDMRDFLEENGESAFLTDDEVRDRFFSGQVWTNFNTAGAVKEAVRSSGYSPEQQSRSARLNQLYNQFPNPWERGGRGWAGVGQGLAAAAADPINFLYPAAGASQAGAKAARAAFQAGQNTTTAAIKAGVGTGIRQEMAVGGIAGGVHDAAMQVRDKNLGVQDEFSLKQLAGQTALGAGIGIPVGAVVGGVAGPFGGARQLRADRAGGQAMLRDRANPAGEDTLLLPAPERENTGSQAIPSEADDSLPTRQELTESDELAQIESQLTESRQNLDDAIADGLDAEVVLEARAEVNMLARLREFRQRLANEQEQIRQLEGSNVANDQKIAADRRNAFEESYSEYRRLFRESQTSDDPNAVRQQVDEAVGKLQDDVIILPPPEAEAPTTGAQAPESPEGGTPEVAGVADETPPPGPETETPPSGAVTEEGGSPEIVEDAFKYSAPSVKQEIGELKAKLDITDDEIASLIADGRIAVGKKGQLVKKSVSDIERIKTAERLEAETPADATPAQNLDEPAPETPTTPDGEVATVDPATLDRDVEEMVRFLDDADYLPILAESNFRPKVVTDMVTKSARMAGITSPPDQVATAIIKKIRDAQTGGPIAESKTLVLTKTEINKRTAKLRRLKRERPELSDEAREMLADDFIMQERQAVADSQAKPRSTQSAIQDKGIYEGAGRTADGRIQSFLRYNTPIAKGSDYTITERFGSQSFEEALIKARTAGELDLQPFIADDARTPFVDANGTKRLMQKGESGFVDGVTGKAFQTKETAVAVREGRTPKFEASAEDVATFKVEKEARDAQLLAQIRQALADDDIELFERLTMERMKNKEGLSEGTQANIENYNRETKALETKSSETGDKLLIVRSKEDGTVRMMTPKQAQNGKTLRDIIGQNANSPRSNPDNWDIKYAPRDQYTRGQKNLVALFDSLPEENAVSNTVAVTPKPDPISFDDARKIQVIPPEGGPNAQRDAQVIGELYQMLSRSQLIPSFDDETLARSLQTMNLFDLQSLVNAASLIKWGAVSDATIPSLIKNIAYVEKRIADLAPEGLQKPVTDIEDSIAGLQSILGGHEADTIAMARKMLIQLAGGEKPIFAHLQGRTQGQFTPADNTIGLNPRTANNTSPQIEIIFHEVGHWAYANILTPEDRADFWRYMTKYYVDGAPDLDKIKEGLFIYTGVDDSPVRSNSLTGPQEFFANQFSMWVARNRVPEAAEESFWKRMASIMKGILERFAFGAQIDPDLERLFSKIMPDRTQAARAKGMDGLPQTEGGKVYHRRVEEMRILIKEMDDAIARDSADGIINAADELTRFMLSIAQKYKNSTGPQGTGTLAPLISRSGSIWKAIHNRVKNIDEIRSPQKAFDYDSLPEDTPRSELGYEDLDGMSIADIQEQADKIAALYADGYGDAFFPALAERTSDGKISEGGNVFNPADTSIRATLQRAEDAIAAAYYKLEDGSVMPGHTPKWERGEKTGKRKTTRKRKVAQREAATTTSMAKQDAKKKKKPAVERKKSKVNKQTADSSKAMSDEEIRRLFREHRGTDYGDQLADEIVRREKTDPILKEVPVSKIYKDTYEPQLLEILMDALVENDTKTIDEVSFEIRRRRTNKILKKESSSKDDYKKIQIIPTFYSRSEIVKEAADSVGVSGSRGIPANARGSIRNLLSYITHRDPEIEYTARTMAYRMLNMMGKTNRFIDGKLNVVDANTVSILSGLPSTESGATVFVDYKSPEFQKFRGDMRKVSIALNKGNVSPFEVVKGVADAVMRSGVLSEDDFISVRQSYYSLPDSEKDRLFRTYGQQYGARMNRLDDLLASDYMSEQLTLYMAGRVAKGDIFQAVATGDLDGITMRSTFERSLDRLTEYVAYLVNGLVGRDDIKQQFRRIFLYGNMFDNKLAPEKRIAPIPLGVGKFRASTAASFAKDTFRARSQTAQANIRGYQGNFASQIPQIYRNGGGGRGPLIFYHGTPNGRLLNHFDNPDVQLMPSMQGLHGAGVYLTINPTAASEVYSIRPTRDGYRNLITKLPEEEYTSEMKEVLLETADELSNMQREIAQDRNAWSWMAQDFEEAYDNNVLRRYTNLAYANDADAPFQTFAQALEYKDDILEEFGQIIAYRVDKANELELELAENGITVDPMVIPVIPAAQRVADFTPTTMYGIGDDMGLFPDFLNRLKNHDDVSEVQINRMLNSLSRKGKNFSGQDLYDQSLDLFQGNVSMRADKVNGILKEAGYDSIIVAHANSAPVSGINEVRSPSGNMIPVSARNIEHLALVIFDDGNSSKKFKHINSTEFDVDESSLFGRGDNPIPRGMSGHIAGLAMDGKINSLNDIDIGSLSEAVEIAGNAEMSNIMGTLARKRNLTDEEITELGRLSPVKMIGRSSDRMKKMGLNWLGSWYKDVYPDITQRFAKKYFPIMHSLNRLPDAQGRGKRWARKVTMDAFSWGDQPKSHSRIVKALRYGEDSRFFNNLSNDEKAVYGQIRRAFDAEREELLAAGVNIGRRKNYLPQVWNAEAIARNKDRFTDAMKHYYKVEHTARGEMADEAQAIKFADDMFFRLSDQANQGTFIPGGGGSRNPTSDALDYGRMIELEKYPESIGRMEEFLEGDLEFLLTKYFEGSSRRLSFMDKLGVNTHGYYDYMMVRNDGAAGIAELLSKNKEFTIAKRGFNNETGFVEDIDFKETIGMPFASRPADARAFADDLVSTFLSSGSVAARKMLDDIAPPNYGQAPNPTYQRRVDAIIGALEDFRGQKIDYSHDDMMFLENAMRVAMKKPPIGATKAGQSASQLVRTLNNVTLLGFTTLTSLSDIVLPLVKTGDLKSFSKALYNFARNDKDYRREIFNIGTSIESIAHNRMVHMYGQVHNKFSDAFFNATMLTPWTDTMRLMATGVGLEAFKTQQIKLRRHFQPGLPVNSQSGKYRTAHRLLSRYGLEDFLPGGSRFNENLADIDLGQDDTMRLALTKFVNDTVFAPNADDIPMWAHTPSGQILFQLKTFPLMMGRLSLDVLKESSQGNFAPLLALSTAGVGMGAATLAAKDFAQLRGGDDEKSFGLRERSLEKTLGITPDIHQDTDAALALYWEGLVQLGGLGLFADLAYQASASADDGAYGEISFASRVLGPTFGLGADVYRMARGFGDAIVQEPGEATGDERQAARLLAMRIPVAGQVRAFREGAADVMGEPTRGGRGPSNPFGSSGFDSGGDFDSDF